MDNFKSFSLTIQYEPHDQELSLIEQVMRDLSPWIYLKCAQTDIDACTLNRGYFTTTRTDMSGSLEQDVYKARWNDLFEILVVVFFFFQHAATSHRDLQYLSTKLLR